MLNKVADLLSTLAIFMTLPCATAPLRYYSVGPKQPGFLIRLLKISRNCYRWEYGYA